MAWTLCTSGSAIVKAGLNANSDIIISGSALAQWSDEAEGSMELDTGMDLVSDITSAPGQIKDAVSDIASSKIALLIIGYDTTGYLSREADTLLNIHDDIINKGMSKLRDFKNTTLNKPWSSS